jgi:hypothetical protein
VPYNLKLYRTRRKFSSRTWRSAAVGAAPNPDPFAGRERCPGLHQLVDTTVNQSGTRLCSGAEKNFFKLASAAGNKPPVSVTYQPRRVFLKFQSALIA